jgi:hypothetical protein
LGAKLWYDFSNDNDWDSKIEVLVKGSLCNNIISHLLFILYSILLKNQLTLSSAIGDHGKGDSNELNSQTFVPPTPANKPGKQVTDWTDDGTCYYFYYFIYGINVADILNWMKAASIEHHYQILKKHGFDGKALAELKALFNPPQPKFFNVVKDICIAMGIEQMGEILKFCAAIRKL